jgi:hypothetical protein
MICDKYRGKNTGPQCVKPQQKKQQLPNARTVTYSMFLIIVIEWTEHTTLSN